MKLYYYPGACSLAVHIVLREAGYKFDLVKVALRKHLTETGVVAQRQADEAITFPVDGIEYGSIGMLAVAIGTLAR